MDYMGVRIKKINVFLSKGDLNSLLNDFMVSVRNKRCKIADDIKIFESNACFLKVICRLILLS